MATFPMIFLRNKFFFIYLTLIVNWWFNNSKTTRSNLVNRTANTTAKTTFKDPCQVRMDSATTRIKPLKIFMDRIRFIRMASITNKSSVKILCRIRSYRQQIFNKMGTCKTNDQLTLWINVLPLQHNRFPRKISRDHRPIINRWRKLIVRIPTILSILVVNNSCLKIQVRILITIIQTVKITSQIQLVIQDTRVHLHKQTKT